MTGDITFSFVILMTSQLFSIHLNSILKHQVSPSPELVLMPIMTVQSYQRTGLALKSSHYFNYLS